MGFLVKGCLGKTSIVFKRHCKLFCDIDRVVEDKEEKQEKLMKNYCEYVHNKFNKYAFGFFFCELLNVVITISQVGIG